MLPSERFINYCRVNVLENESLTDNLECICSLVLSDVP